MSALGRLVVQLALDHAEYTKGLEKNSQAALKFAQKTQRTFDNASSNIKSFATRSVAQIGVLIGSVAGLNASLNSALDFDRQLAEVSTLLSGTAEETKILASEAERLAQQFGTMPIDQAKAFYQVISAGASDASEATDILTAANKLAVGGVTDVLTSVDGLTSILNAYGDQVESASAVSDTLFIGMRSGKTTIAELSTGLGKVAPLAASLNVGFDELVGSIAALTKGGINTTESITGVRAILAAVAKPTKEAATLSDQLGIEFNAAGLQAKGFAEFLDEVSNKTGGSVDKLSLLFGGVEALVPIMALSGNAGSDFNAIMAQMGEKAGATEEAFNKMADSRGFKIDQLMASINSIALTLGGTLADVLAPAAEWAAQKMNQLFGAQRELTAIEKQKNLISELQAELDSLNNRKNIPVIGDLIFDKRQADLLEQRIEDGVADLNALEKQMQETAKAAESLNKPIIKTGENQGKSSPPTKTLTSLLGDQDQAMKQLEREVKSLTLAYDPLIKRNEELANLVRLRGAGLSEGIFDQEAARIINEYIAATGEAAESVGEITGQTDILGARTVEVFGSNEQFIIQSMRNVQSAVSNSLFNFFDDGLKGMVRSVKSAVGRIIAEFASIKILQASGIGAIFGLGSGAALASGGGGFDVANAGLTAANFVSSGFGLPGFVGNSLAGAGEFLGVNALTQFGSGLSGDAIAAFAGPAAGAGSALSAIAAPAAIAAVADIALRSIFGDKKLGGTAGDVLGYVPVVGTLINGLFGRGPLEKKETNLIGDFTSDGFSGVTSAKFKAEGGLFRGDKVDRIITDVDSGELLKEFRELSEGGISKSLGLAADQEREFALKLGSFLDESVKGISGALRGAADNLGLGTDAIDNFSSSINIASEKGQALSEQQIGDEIARVADQMSTALIPEIDSLRESGETASQAVSRINSEFRELQGGLQLLGVETEAARNFLQGFSIEQRGAFIDQAGGIQKFSSDVQQLFDGLNDSNKLDIFKRSLQESLESIGVGFIPTLEEFNDAMLSGKLSTDQFLTGLRLQPLVKEVDTLTKSLDDLGETAEKTAEKIEEENRKRASASERNEFTSDRRAAETAAFKSIEDQKALARDADIRFLQESAERQKELIQDRFELEEDLLDLAKERSGVISSFIDSLRSAATNILPDSFNDARNLVGRSINAVRGGADFESIITDRLKSSLGSLGNLTSANFRTFEEFKIAQGEAANAVNELASLGDNQLSVEHLTLDELEKQTHLLNQLLARDLQRVDSGLEFDLKSVGSFAGITTAADTYKKIVSNQFARVAHILANDEIPDPFAVADSQRRAGIIANSSTADINRSLPTGFSPFGVGLTSGSANTELLIAEIRRLSQLVSEGNKTNEKTASILGDVTQGGNSLKTSAA